MRLIAIAWQGVRGFPVRTTLTVLSLMVGIVGLVSVYSASESTVSTVEQRAILTGGPSSTFNVSGLSGNSGFNRSRLLLDQLRASLGPEVLGARLERVPAITLEVAEEAIDADLTFVDPELMDIRRFPMAEGLWLRKTEASGLSIVLNQAAFDAGHLRDSMRLRLRVQHNAETIPVTVQGVVMDGSGRPSAYVHIDHLPALLVNQEGLHTTSFELSAPELTNTAVSERLRELDRLTGASTSWNIIRRDTVNQLAAEVVATRSSFLAVGVLGILATAFAVSNVGLSALRERSVELSLRRAVGSPRWQIPALMILESQIIALIAGALAVPLSYLIYPLVADQFGTPFGVDPPSYPWPSAFLGLGLGMVTALVGSAAPAIRALKIPISSMMRE